MDSTPIRVLLIDDDEDDFIITQDVLHECFDQYVELEWVSTYSEGLNALKLDRHSVYLIDYRLGEFSGLELLKEAVNSGLKSPVILLTGQGDREVDVEAMRAGAADYLSKDRLDAVVLERSIRYSIDRKRSEKEKEELIVQLKDAMEKTLAGMLPICAGCKKIRDADGNWAQVEKFLKARSGTEFSHSICPDCVVELYPKHAANKSGSET